MVSLATAESLYPALPLALAVRPASLRPKASSSDCSIASIAPPLRQGELMAGRQNHRERLLDGALRCVRELGYAHTTARDIARVSGSNLGSIGYHFGSKEALLEEAMRLGFAAWLDELEQMAFAEGGATPLARLRASWSNFTESLERHRPLMVAFVEAIAQAERSEELRGHLAELYEESRTRVAELVRASLGSELRGDTARVVASFLIAVYDGVLLQWLVDPERASSGSELISALEETIPLALARELEPAQAS